jgi:hypothetical protein
LDSLIFFPRVSQANATSTHQYDGLTITSHTGSVGTTGNYNGAYLVKGVIQNTGSQTTQNVTVVATFYNSTGGVVAIGYNTVNVADSLGAGQTVDFQVPAFDLNQSLVPSNQKISSYSLTPQSLPTVQGEASPVATPTVGSTTDNPATASPTDGASNPVNNGGASNTWIIYAAVIVVVAAVVGGVLLMKKRSGRAAAVKETRKQKNRTPKSKRQ